ncbi:Exosome complex component RRP41 [Saitoella coloradoensis]
MSNDRRRNLGPSSSAPPIYQKDIHTLESQLKALEQKDSQSTEPQKFFLKTSLLTKPNGSSYLELHIPSTPTPTKLLCAIYGPRPTPRSTPYFPTATLTLDLSFSPFSTRTRSLPHLRSPLERTLAKRIEDAIRSAIRAELYPKTQIEIFVCVLEAPLSGAEADADAEGVWSAAVNAVGAAVVDAGIEMRDIPSAASVDGVSLATLLATGEITELSSKGKIDMADWDKRVEDCLRKAAEVRGVVNAVLRRDVERRREEGDGMEF